MEKSQTTATIDVDAKVAEFYDENLSLAERASKLTVASAADYEVAAQFRLDLKTGEDRISEWFEPIRQQTHAAWQAIVSKRKETINPLRDADAVVHGKMKAWRREEDARREKEQAEAQAKADAAAEKERRRLEKQAEKLKTPELKEQRLAEAAAVEAPIVAVENNVPKITGISASNLWRVRITDKLAFVRHVGNNPDLLAFVEINETALRKVAQATSGAFPQPGVEFYQEEIIRRSTSGRA